MTQVGFNTFQPKEVDTVFEVRNVTLGTQQEKQIHIFNYPIPPGRTRDLLAIPQVSEADIRHALLKGDLKVKGVCGEICIVRSNIDLIQFDDEQKAFIESLACTPGAVDGLEGGGGSSFNFAFKQNVELLGTKDGKNRVFTTPDKFINADIGSNSFRILIRHDGKGLIPGVDYTLSESMGAGTGFDTITFIQFAPKAKSTLIADYVVSIP